MPEFPGPDVPGAVVPRPVVILATVVMRDGASFCIEQQARAGLPRALLGELA